MQTIAVAIEDQPIGQKYIWRTVGDEKVRGDHAAREGKVFSWLDRPVPGDDYNCRCWAEKLDAYKDAIDPVYPELLLPFFRGGTAIRAAWKLFPDTNKRNPEWTLGDHKKTCEMGKTDGATSMDA